MILVTCAIIETNGKVLLARRGPGQKLAGKWEFPGGKVEDGESLGECLRRELEEEFGIRTKVGEFITSSRYQYDHVSIELLAFRAEYISGTFSLKDHDEIAWKTPEELLDLDLSEADIPIARVLADQARYHPGGR